MPSQWKPSYYNHAVSYNGKMLIFNGVSSGLVMVDADFYESLRFYLFEDDCFDVEIVTDSNLKSTLKELFQGQYLLEASIDELDYLRQRFRTYQRNDPLSVTIATTMDCNLACYYCFEDKYPVYLSLQTCDQIYEYIVREVNERDLMKVFTAWYGGEPMLNSEAIEYLSRRIITFCDARGIKYRSSMISNGTVWPADAVDFVVRNRIRHIQFSFDGLPESHNRRRRYKDRDVTASSFEQISQTVNRLLGHAKLYLRMNLDRDNLKDAYRLADYFYEKGWLYPGSQVYPYLAHLGPLTSVCNFMENSAIKLDEFDHLNNDFRRYLSKYVDIREFQHLQQYPLSIKLNCAAVASHSVLFGPDGAMYKCSHEVGVHAKSHDHVSAKRTEAKSHSLPVLSGDPNSSSGSGKSGAYDYLSYDPFSHPTCSKCRYLPVCMGGCPKTQFEKNQYYIEGCQRFWQNSFEPMIRTFADAILGGGIPLDHSVQEVEKEIDVFGI